MAIHAASPMPVLPPLRLNEPAPTHIQLPSIHELCPDYDRKKLQSTSHRSRAASPYARPPLRPRQNSIALSSRSSTTPSPPPIAASSIRIVLVSSWDEADSALILPTPGPAPSTPTAPAPIVSENTVRLPQAPYLLLGNAFARFKAKGCVVPPGVRMYPYRLERFYNHGTNVMTPRSAIPGASR